MRIRVVRGFYDLHRQARRPGEILDVPLLFAYELIANKKAERILEAPPVLAVRADEPSTPAPHVPEPEKPKGTRRKGG